VRQLKNAVERMAVLSPVDSLTPDLLPPEILSGPSDPGQEPLDLPYREALHGFKKRLIVRALARVGGNQTRAAEQLGVQRTYLNRLIKELGLQD
jgi:DNA-binding NtrC family response regulator